jgi:hypothetical protein
MVKEENVQRKGRKKGKNANDLSSIKFVVLQIKW